MCIRDSVCYDQAEKFESEPVYKKRKKMLEYVQKAPSLFGVRGTPVLLVMSPDGTKVDTLRGYYTGQNALYFDQIKNSVKPVSYTHLTLPTITYV